MRFDFFMCSVLLLLLTFGRLPAVAISSDVTRSTNKSPKLTPTQTVLSILPEGQSIFGQEVIFSVRVAPTYLLDKLPTGSVQFYIDDTLVATQPLLKGIATHTSSSVAASLQSSHHIKVVYLGDTSYESSTDVLEYEVLPGNTAVKLSSSKNPAFWGETIQFTIVVHPLSPAVAVPRGSIQLEIEENDSETIALDAKGKASFSTAKLEVGDREIKASFLADGNFNPSSDALLQRIAKTATKTVLTSSENPSLSGKDVSFTATVYSPFKEVIPAGAIQFRLDGNNSGDPIAINQKGEARANFQTLSVGNRTIEARFLGNEHFLPSKHVIIQKVNQAPAESRLNDSENPAPATSEKQAEHNDSEEKGESKLEAETKVSAK